MPKSITLTVKEAKALAGTENMAHIKAFIDGYKAGSKGRHRDQCNKPTDGETRRYWLKGYGKGATA